MLPRTTRRALAANRDRRALTEVRKSNTFGGRHHGRRMQVIPEVSAAIVYQHVPQSKLEQKVKVPATIRLRSNAAEDLRKSRRLIQKANKLRKKHGWAPLISTKRKV